MEKKESKFSLTDYSALFIDVFHQRFAYPFQMFLFICLKEKKKVEKFKISEYSD